MTGFDHPDRIETVKFKSKNHVPDFTTLQVHGRGGAPKDVSEAFKDSEGLQSSSNTLTVSPLVMYRQSLRQGREGHPHRHMSSDAAGTHRKAFVTSSRVFQHPVSQHQLQHLPKPPARARPKSAEPVTCRTLHLSSGHYTCLDPARSKGQFKLPCFEEASCDTPLTRRHVPVTLVASQLMQSATPPGVNTGEDAVHYFSTNKHQSTGSLFIFCNFVSSDPSIHDPYSLVVVDSSAVAAEHCVVSCTGVCHIRPNDSGNTVSQLHTWAAEARQFRTLKQLTFFKKFEMVNAWAHWKTGHQAGKFSRRAKFLETQHLMLNPWFGHSMRSCHCLAASATTGCTGAWQRVGSTWHVSTLSSSLKEVYEKAVPVSKENLVSGALSLPLRLSFLGHEACCHQLKGFQKIRTDMRDSVSAAMDIVAGEIASLVHILAVDVDQELEDSYPAELKRTALRKITRRRPSPRARLRARSLLVKKFVNMTAMQRYDHAKMHAALLPRALRLADLRVMGAMVDLALTSVQLAMRQLLQDSVTICHSAHPVQYKHGLWVISGEVIPKKRRLDIQSVLRLSPSAAELCSHATAVLREIVGVAAATRRPLELDHLVQHYNSFSPNLHDDQLSILAFSSVFKTMCDIDSQQASITQLLESDYEAARASNVMTAFTNVGELFTFMEAFDSDAYLTATPSCEDVCLDLGILQRWIADLKSLHPTLQKGLLLFDLSSLRLSVLETAETTMKAFIKLANDWLYDNCIRVRAAAVSASDGIGIGAPPSDLSDFMAWVNRNGDHFAGDQSARKHLMQSVESLQRMHSQLAQERSKFSKERVGSRNDREMESLSAAMEAFDSMAAVLKVYNDRCDHAHMYYQERIPVMGAKVSARVREIWSHVQQIMSHARSDSGLAAIGGDPHAMQQMAAQLRASLTELVSDAAVLEKIQEMLVSEGRQAPSEAPLISKVKECTRHLDSLKHLWNSIALWTRVSVTFSSATLLTSTVKVATLNRALADLDTAICAWEARTCADGVLDVEGLTPSERALVDRLRAVHTAWQQGSEILPELVSPSLQERHRAQLERELQGLRSTLEGSNRPIDRFLWLGAPPDPGSELTLLDQGDPDVDEAVPLESTSKGKAVVMHAVTFATALVNAAAVKTVSLAAFVGPPLVLEDPSLAPALEGAKLWRILSLLTISGAAKAVFKRLYKASSEDSQVLHKLMCLRERVSNLRLELSVRREYGCLLLTNLPEVLSTVREASDATALLLSGQAVTPQLRSEFSEAEAQLATYESALLAADKTQTLWLHLSRILAEESAQMLVKSDMPAFHEVQTRWRVMQVQIMDGAATLADASALAGPLSHCSAMLQVLQRIYNRLLTCTSAMRDNFPRFHLCSDAEVVSALAFARAPLELPPSMLSTCFPGAVALVTDTHEGGGGLCVIAVQGCNGDTLQLLEPIPVDQAPLAEWLAHLEIAIKSGLRTHTAAALKLASTMDSRLWRSAFPQQAMYLCDGCTFTFTVERALAALASGENPHALRTCSEMMAVRVESLTQQVAAVEVEERPGLRMLVLAAIAHRDSVARLLAERTADPAAWAWQREIRHSWRRDSNECYVQVADVRVPFQWEYCGGHISEAALLLAHCDRSVALACAALHHDGGLQLIPAGPSSAGTPVPCYAEAIARVFGRFLVSVECTPKLGSLEVLRMVQGMIAMNAWGFFENVSRLSQDMVSFLSSVVLQLQAALAARIESTTVANVTFDLPHQPVLQDAVSQPFALMFSGPSPSHATLAPRAQRQLIDEFFASHSRRVVLMAAPISLMIEAALRQQGLRQADQASHATAAFLRTLRMQLPAFCNTHCFGSCMKFLTKCVWDQCQGQRNTSALTCSRRACDAMIASILPEDMKSCASEILVEAFGPDLGLSKRQLSRSRASTIVQHQFDAMNSAFLDLDGTGSDLEEQRATAARCNTPTQVPRIPRHTLKLDEALDSGNLEAKSLIDDQGLRVLKPKATLELIDLLEGLVSSHACTMIVGPPGSGKTSLWHLLKTALQQTHMMRDEAVMLTPEDVVSTHHIHANAMSLDELFGSSRMRAEVNDSGIIGSVLHPTEPGIHARTVASAAAGGDPGASAESVRPPHFAAGHSWLVIDCALEGGHADQLAPLLLGQAVWCSDGTRARIHGGQRLLWECTDLKGATPLTISTVGICAVPPALIDAYAIIDGVQDLATTRCPLLKLEQLHQVWRFVPGIVQHVHGSLLKGAGLSQTSRVNDRWVTVIANSISALAPGTFNVNLTLWDAHSFQGNRTAADSALLLQLCIIFIVSWAARGACSALSMDISDDVLEAMLRQAFQTQDLECAPPEDALWSSYIDAPNIRWTSWVEMLQARAAAKGPELVTPDGTLLLAPLSGTSLCLRHLMGAGMSSGASVLIEGRTQATLDVFSRSLLGSVRPMESDTSFQWISCATSAVSAVHCLRVLIRGCMAEIHPRLMRSKDSSRIALRIDDVHVGKPGSDAPSSILEFIRSYLDLQGFIHPAQGYTCCTPDLQLCASAVPSLFPSSAEIARTRAKLLCISPAEVRSSIMSGSVLSKVSLMQLQSTCDAFMSVMQDSMGECMPTAPAAQLSSFLASIIQGAHNSGIAVAPGLCFDIDAVQRMLECVHADLTLPSIDDVQPVSSGPSTRGAASGSAVIALFGCMLEGQDSEEALARRALTTKITRMQDTLKGSDELRMEHLWLAIAAECVNSLWSNTSSHNRSFITEHVGLLLQDQLTDLCRFYDEIPETKQASHQAGTLDVSQLALGLWNTDLAAEESSGDDDEPEPRRSRLLIGLDQAQIQQLALLTVTCGIAVIASRPQVVRKSVMPLQPELLQALLLQGIRLVPEADTGGHPLHLIPEERQPGKSPRNYLKTLESTAECLRDLRFVSDISRLITAVRRPFAMGCCILVSAYSGIQAIHCVAAYLQASVAPLWAEDVVGTRHGSRSMLLRQLIRAAASAAMHCTPVIIVASNELMQDPDQLWLLQEFIVTGMLNNIASPSELLRAFSDDLQQFVDAIAALGCVDELQEALPGAGLPWPKSHSSTDQPSGSRTADHETSVSTNRSGVATSTVPQRARSEAKVIDAEQRLMHRLNRSLEDVAELLRVCVCMHPADLHEARGACPSLFRRSMMVQMSDTSSPLDRLACQHMIMCNYQHILRPWNNDLGREEAEAPRSVTTAAQLLQRTCEGTVSGLTFMEVTEFVTEPVLRLIQEAAKTDNANSHVPKGGLSYSAVLSQACAKHVFAGRTLTPGTAAAMRSSLKQCSSAVLHIHAIGRTYLEGVQMQCSMHKQLQLLEVASIIYSRYHKHMRHHLGQLSHFLQLAEGLNKTHEQLKEDLSVSAGQSTHQAASESDTREHLSQATARLEQMLASQAELESIVNRAEKEVAYIKSQAAADIEELRLQYRTSVTAVLQLAERDLVELRTYSAPPAAVTQVLAAVCTILGFPSDWESALMLMNHSDVTLIQRITDFDVLALPQARLMKLRALLQDAELQPGRVAAVSDAAQSLAVWVRAVEAHSSKEDIRRRMLRATRAVLDSSSASQEQMVENAVELQQLKATVSELTQKIDAAMHGHRVIDTSARAREGKLSTLAAVKEALAPRIAATHARVAALQRFLSCLLGDALCAAAVCVYAGMLPSAAQLSFQREVQQALHEAGVPHTPDLALSQWMEFLEQQYTLLPQRVVMDADLQHTMYCVSLVRGLVLLVDREGEGLGLCKALHAQAPQGPWLEVTLDSVAALHKAVDAMSSGCTVAVAVADMDVAERLIPSLARHLQLVPPSTANRLLLHTRLPGPWPPALQASTVMLSFAAGSASARLHMESAMIAATDRTAEECRRMELANVAMCKRKCSEIRGALYQLTSSMQADCWHDPALCSVVMRRLKGWSQVEQEQATAEARLQEIMAAAACFAPALHVTDALWAAMTALRRHSLAFDVPFPHVLPWWQSVFHAALRAAQASALHRTSPRLSGASQGGNGDCEAAASESDVGRPEAGVSEAEDSSTSDSGSESTGSSDSSNSASGSARSAARDLVRTTTATESTRLAARLRAKMLLPVQDFCAALLRSTAWWFDAAHCTVLISMFHTFWGVEHSCGGSSGGSSQDAQLICDLLCRHTSLLQIPVLLTTEGSGGGDPGGESDGLGAGPPGTSVDTTSTAEQHRPAMRLDSADVESLAWLESRCPSLTGLVAAIKKDPAAFYCKRRPGLLVEQLPMPFAHLRAALRALLAMMLWPSEARATLAWLSETCASTSLAGIKHTMHGVPDTFMQLDAASRFASALLCSDGYRPILMHANAAEPPAQLLMHLISVDRRGVLACGAPAVSAAMEALSTASAGATPRPSHTQLRVLHLSAHVPLAACSGMIEEAASLGQWVLLSCAHLRPDICHACVAVADALWQSDSLSPRFRLFLACPTAELWRLPLRYGLLPVNYGDDRAAPPVALHLLRAMDSAAGSQLGLFDDISPDPLHFANVAPASQPVPARLPLHHRSALQQWAERIAGVLAAVVERTCGIGACGVLADWRCACTDRDFIHVLHLLKAMIGRSEGGGAHAARPADLQAAILQVAVELGQGQAAVRSVGQQILQDELGSCHLRVGVPSRQAGPASRLAREPIASLSAFLRKAAAGKVGKYNPDGGGCMHGAGCAPACQARGTRQVLNVLYGCSPPTATPGATSSALEADVTRLRHQLTGIQHQIDALYRRAQRRLAQALDEPSEASTPSRGMRATDCSCAPLGPGSEAASQLPTLLNAPLPPRCTSSDSHSAAGEGPDGTQTQQSACGEAECPSDGGLQGEQPAEKAVDVAASADMHLLPPRTGTFRRFSALTATPGHARSLLRRSFAAAGDGEQGQEVRFRPGDTCRNTVAACGVGVSQQLGRAAASRSVKHPGLEETNTLEPSAAGRLPGWPRVPGYERPGRYSVTDKAPRRKRITLRSTASATAAPSQPQNILVLGSTAASEAGALTDRSQTLSGGISTQKSMQSVGGASSKFEIGGGGSLESADPSEAERLSSGSRNTWQKPPRLREHATNRKRAVLLGQCLLQEVVCIGQAVSGALASAARLQARCAREGTPAVEVGRFLSTLSHDNMPAGWTAGRDRGGGQHCVFGPWLQARTVAGWLERVRHQVQRLQGLVDSDWGTVCWAAILQDLAWPGALVAASERLFAASNQYVLAQVGTLASVGVCQKHRGLEGVYFQLPPAGCNTAGVDSRLHLDVPHIGTCPWRSDRAADAGSTHAAILHCKPALSARKRAKLLPGQEPCDRPEGQIAVAWVQDDAAGAGAHLVDGLCGGAHVAAAAHMLNQACSEGLVLEEAFEAFKD